MGHENWWEQVSKGKKLLFFLRCYMTYEHVQEKEKRLLLKVEEEVKLKLSYLYWACGSRMNECEKVAHHVLVK